MSISRFPDNRSRLLDADNHPSLLVLAVYECKNDADLDEWIMDYFKRNNVYFRDQKENYRVMREDLKEYLDNG